MKHDYEQVNEMEMGLSTTSLEDIENRLVAVEQRLDNPTSDTNTLSTWQVAKRLFAALGCISILVFWIGFMQVFYHWITQNIPTN